MDKVDAILEGIDALDDDELDVLLSSLHDDITRWLDRHGWMVVVQPQHDGLRYGAEPTHWFLCQASDDCPPWCDNGLMPGPPPPPWGRSQKGLQLMVSLPPGASVRSFIPQIVKTPKSRSRSGTPTSSNHRAGSTM